MEKLWKKEAGLDLKPFLEEAKRLVLAHDSLNSEAKFYLTPVEYVRAEENVLVVSVPSAFFRDQFQRLFLEKFKNALQQLTGQDFAIQIEVTSDLPSPPPSPERTAASSPAPEPQKSFSNLVIPREPHPETGLDPLKTFENFIVGEENLLAYNTALAISKNPGVDYNPLFLYGSVGLGKTHLMHAIGNAIQKNFPNAVIRCISSENFVSEFVYHVMNNSTKTYAMKKFKEQYRKLDVLLLDDVYDLQGKEESQEELFHTFNELYDHKKQLVFTCDRPPRELKKFNERLISRFLRGAIRDLKVPSWETRMAILKRKMESLPFTVSEDIIKYLATEITSNVRDLESAITNIKSYVELTNSALTLETVQKAIQPIKNTVGYGSITVDTIQRVVASYYNLTAKDLKDKRKTKTIALARQVAMYITKEMTELSTIDIGLEFGGRDHTTVLHSLNKIQTLIRTDSKMDSVIQNLVNLCREQYLSGS